MLYHYYQLFYIERSPFSDTSRHKYRSIFVTPLNAKKDRMTFVSTVLLKGKHP